MKTFQELELIAPLHRALADENYSIPTPIQAQTVPAALAGQDVLGCAQTGTGKTAAFALPILNRLAVSKHRPAANRPLALILAPTRELAIQIGASFATYGRHLKLRTSLVYGGVSQVNQVRSLARGTHILVATPGRLLDLMNQGHVDLSQLEVFVLDEADRMLDMGFLPDLKRIISQLPRQRQSLFFSATMPPNIVELSQRLLTDPITVNVTPKSSSVQRIEQQVLFVDRGDRQDILRQLLALDDVERAIVFTRTKRGANVVAEKLLRTGIRAVAIHGNKSQNARQRALESFRSQEVRVLVATDVAARGIDIDGITHVVNFDMPVEAESYVHRIGRTGRAGADGIALSFCTQDEYDELKAIERLIGHAIPSMNQRPPMDRAAAPSRPAGRPPQSRGRRPASGRRSSTGTGSTNPRGGTRSRRGGGRPTATV